MIMMKRLELSDVTSNLLLGSSVMMAFVPFVLGDRLGFFVSSAMRECTVLMDQFSTFVVQMLS
jgi:hypothetical protein